MLLEAGLVGRRVVSGREASGKVVVLGTYWCTVFFTR